MCSIVNQSTARKSDQSEVAISGRLANQKPGKRTNQKAGYEKKQQIDCRDSHFIRHVTSIKIKRPHQGIEHSVNPDTRGSATRSLSSNVRQRPDPIIESKYP